MNVLGQSEKRIESWTATVWSEEVGMGDIKETKKNESIEESNVTKLTWEADDRRYVRTVRAIVQFDGTGVC